MFALPGVQRVTVQNVQLYKRLRTPVDDQYTTPGIPLSFLPMLSPYILVNRF